MDGLLGLLLILPLFWCCGIWNCRANVFSDIKNTAEKAGEGIKHAAEKTGAFVKDTAETWKKDLEAAKEKATKDTRFYTFAIIKPYLFLGGFFSLNKKNIEQYGITANVNAGHPLGKRKIITKYHLEYKQIGVSDFPTENIGKYFQDTTAWMEAERQKFGGKGRIWVNCFEGVSRSASIVVAYLVRYDERKWTADQYIEHIKKDHRKIRINDGFKKQLHEWENQVKSFNPNERHKSVQGQEKIGARPVALKALKVNGSEYVRRSEGDELMTGRFEDLLCQTQRSRTGRRGGKPTVLLEPADAQRLPSILDVGSKRQRRQIDVILQNQTQLH